MTFLFDLMSIFQAGIPLDSIPVSSSKILQGVGLKLSKIDVKTLNPFPNSYPF